MHTKALYAGSFDPITLGHLDIIRRAAKIFDELVIGVTVNLEKKTMFTFEERMDMIKEVTKDMPNVEVRSYTGMTIDFAREVGATCIVRGLRTTTDFELESVIAQANKKMAPDIHSIFIPSSLEYSFISSTVVRDVLASGGDTSYFLPKGININEYERQPR